MQRIEEISNLTEAQNNISQENKYVTLLLNNVWRFIIDDKDQINNDPLIYDKDREKRKGEPGYLQSMSNAMIMILKDIHTPLSLELIVALHDIAVDSVIFHKGKPGVKGIRSEPRWFRLRPQVNITHFGFMEILFVNNSLASIIAPDAKESTIGNMFEEMNVTPYIRFDAKKNSEFECTLQNFLTDKLNEIIMEYNQDINQSGTDQIIEDTNKLLAIARFSHKANLLHPFHDGNVRTFVNLITNKLLIKNGFPPAIFEDPNRFDAYSKLELCIEIINGMQKTLFYLVSWMNLKIFKID